MFRKSKIVFLLIVVFILLTGSFTIVKEKGKRVSNQRALKLIGEYYQVEGMRKKILLRLRDSLSGFLSSLRDLYFHAAYAEDALRKIIILYTSDSKGHILPYIPRDSEWFWKNYVGVNLGEEVGGYASRSRYIRKVRREAQEEGAEFLLLEAGDFLCGSAESNYFKGGMNIELMNYLNYDAATIGNLDYNFGEETIRELSRQADFPFLGANVLNKETNEIVDYLQPYFIKDLSEIRVGILGLTRPDMESIAKPETIEGIVMGETNSIVAKGIQELKEEGVDLIVILSHMSSGPDRKLAGAVSGIDVIISSERITPYCYGRSRVINETILAPAINGKVAVGRLELYLDQTTKEIVHHKAETIFLPIKNYPPDEEALDIIDGYRDRAAWDLERIIGYAERDILHNWWRESAIGNLVCDALREATGADIAFYNTLGIRDSLAKGDIKKGDLINILPFDNDIVTLSLTGEEVVEMLNEGTVYAPQLSGVKVIYNPQSPKGPRVVEVKINEEPLEMERLYHIATCNFLVAKGPGLVTFQKGKDIYNTGVKAVSALEDYIYEHSPISITPEQRILPEKGVFYK